MTDLMAAILASIRTRLTHGHGLANTLTFSDVPASDLAACLAAFTQPTAVDLACNVHGTALCLTALWHTPVLGCF